jgi:predicted PolB exonuclease-like 3'-5' exonuclease
MARGSQLETQLSMMTFAVFDIETRIDKRLINQVFKAHEGLTDEAAYEHFRQDPRNRGGDFIPLSLHVPISIAIGMVDADYSLRSVESLALSNYSEERIVREFWAREEDFDGSLVSFNGRGFDLPVLELAALRYGIAAPRYFGETNSARARHADRHLDLYDFLCNYGASGIRGGMDLILKMLGLPGKRELDGSQVQDYYEARRLDEIHRYCRSDVTQTYFLFIRVELMRGRLDLAGYDAVVRAAQPYLTELEADPPARGAD